MSIKYLHFVKKWIVKNKKGEALAVGDTLAEALGEALRVIKTIYGKI
jgi:carbamoylphosphate synthase large subunit